MCKTTVGISVVGPELLYWELMSGGTLSSLVAGLKLGSGAAVLGLLGFLASWLHCHFDFLLLFHGVDI